MNRKKKLVLNTYSSLINQLILVISGFILPKLYLQNFGSELNGLVSSITQFINIITFMELGIGAVVQSSLYKPLVEKNNKTISMIVKSANNFFKVLAKIFLVYIAILMIFYPIFIKNSFGYMYVSLLILILSISLFAQYYFGLVNQLLLIADQKAYIYFTLNCLCILLNTIMTYILIKYFNVSLHVAKLSTACIYLVKPLMLYLYVKRHYKIDKHVKIEGEPIKQKWNGIAQHISAVVLSNTDSIVLTFLVGLKSVSIYGVYNIVLSGLNGIIISLSAGFQSLMGEYVSNNNYKQATNLFDQFEWIMHNTITILFSCTVVLIVPFVKIYTSGINDANYIQPVFAIFMTLGQAFYCLRTTYYCVIKAAGHYKETQISAIIEMILNIVISVILAYKLGLIGVALGTVVAIIYRTMYCVIYMSNKILARPIKLFFYQLFQDILVLLLICSSSKILHFEITSFLSWIIYAVIIFGVAIFFSLIINLLFNRKKILNLGLNKMKKI